MRKVARRILEDIDYIVDEAEDGQEAFDKCRQEMPDAILLDWQMPVMGGLEFLNCCGLMSAAPRPSGVLRHRERYRPDRTGDEGRRVGLHDEAVRPRHSRSEVPAASRRALPKPAEPAGYCSLAAENATAVTSSLLTR